MNYLNYQFTVTPPEPGSEILMAIIADFGFETFNTTPNGFEAFIKEDEAKNINLSEIQFDDFTYTFTIQKIEQTNWNNEWEKNFEPVIIDDLLAIRAHFHQPIKNVKFNIEITPKMSFGTGHHQTTRLVSKQLFNLNIKNKRVLDMGCGTGILAILAEFLGANNVLGIDIDEWSVENSIENVAINKCKTIHIKKGDVQDLENENNFDIILANINKNILKQHIPTYSKKLNPDGKLILSGFFTTDATELIDLCKQHQLVLETNNFENEWAMLMMSKR
jgi:ribosomal protein L11 methyltransferase